MKRYLALLLAFVMVLSFTGCEKTTRNGGEGGTTNPASEPAESKVETTAAPTEEETKTEAEPVDDGPADEPYESDEVEVLSLKRGTMSTYNWNDEYETILIYASYPFVYLDGDSETEYAALNDSLNQYNEKLREKDYAEYAACLGDALYMIEEEPESFLSFNIKKNAKVRRADSNVLSILYEDDSYVGIRRSEHFYSGVTFDSKTGKQLELSDVVTDMSKVPALVKEQLQTFYDADRLEYAVDIEDYFRDQDTELKWVLDYNGLTFVFGTYEIAPRGAGTFAVTLTFKDNPGLVKDEYTAVPKSYCSELLLGNQFYYDLDDDEVSDVILVEGQRYDENPDMYKTQTIYGNSVWYEDEVYSYKIDPILVHSENGNYLYVENAFDDDIHQITVYDMNAAYPTRVDAISCSMHDITEEDSDENTVQVLTNPKDFILDSKTDLLSTKTGYKYYNVGNNGMPVSDALWYRFDDYLLFEVLKPLEVTIVSDKTGDEIGDAQISDGFKVQYYRTDDKSFADFLLPDGRIGRVPVEVKDWEKYIYGEKAEEYFDGMSFAG
ncbi:MAG: DUF3298 domain-containing protein [Lachnospiraceae bacterium]|nr:DUF3298 domain-containing protein [Lachnospiraceae bacterium]